MPAHGQSAPNKIDYQTPTDYTRSGHLTGGLLTYQDFTGANGGSVVVRQEASQTNNLLMGAAMLCDRVGPSRA